VVHVARPEVFNDPVPSIVIAVTSITGTCISTCNSEDFTKGVLSVADVWRNLALNDHFGIRRDKKLIAHVVEGVSRKGWFRNAEAVK